jgi:class 3 adenylate cyclase
MVGNLRNRNTAGRRLDSVTTRFARVGDAHVAYRTLGDGPPDILYFLGEYIPVDAIDEEPRYAHAMRRLNSMGRVIPFNRRGIGLSDQPDGPLTHQQNVEDALAVLDHLGTDEAIILGANLVSGAAAMCFAAQHPDRTSALVLVNTVARAQWAEDYVIGVPAEYLQRTGEQTVSPEKAEEFDWLTAFAPSVARDERFRDWWDRAGNRGASPSRARELWSMVLATDVRDALPRIDVPTLVIRRIDALVINHDLTRYVADNIKGAKYVELPGKDLPWWVGDADAVLDEIEAFVSGRSNVARAQRRLATVLFLDIVSSTQRAAEIGDARWRALLETFVELARREVGRGGGRLVSTSGDGVLATFDMPADAVRAGARLAEAVRALSIDVRAGVHTGEVEIVGDDVAGIGVHIAARVMDAAATGEVLVSRTVCDLVTGSGLVFENRGEHDLKGVPGRWQLFALKP